MHNYVNKILVCDCLPGKIHNLCDISLCIGFGTNAEVINHEIVENIISDGAFFRYHKGEK